MTIRECIRCSRIFCARAGSWSSQVPGEVSSTGSRWDLPGAQDVGERRVGGTKTASPRATGDSGAPGWMEASPARRKTGGAPPAGRCGPGAPRRTGPTPPGRRWRSRRAGARRGRPVPAPVCMTSRVLPMRVLASLRMARRSRARRLLGDIDAHGAHPQRLAVGVLEAEERGRERVLPARTRRRPRPVLVDLGGAALQHLPHHCLERFGLGMAGHRVKSSSEPSVTGDAVVALHRVVRPRCSAAAGHERRCRSVRG